LKDVCQELHFFDRAEQLLAILERHCPELLLFSSTKTCLNLVPLTRAFHGLALTLDTCWPFAPEAVPGFVDRIDRLLVSLPRPVFQQGLKENGGPFEYPPWARHRMAPIGWMADEGPDLERQSLVMLYVGFFPGATEEQRWKEVLAGAMERAMLARPAFRWLWVGGPSDWLPPGVEHVPWLPPQEFERTVRSASLLVCHHATTTIPFAAVAGTPVLALGPGEVYSPQARLVLADQELQALAMAGVVDACLGPTEPAQLARRMVALLDGGPWRPWPGEPAEAAVVEAEKLLG